MSETAPQATQSQQTQTHVAPVDPLAALDSRAGALQEALRNGTFKDEDDGEANVPAKEANDAGDDTNAADGSGEAGEEVSASEVGDAADGKAEAKPKNERTEALERAFKLERENVQKAAKLSHREAEVAAKEEQHKAQAEAFAKERSAWEAEKARHESVWKDPALWMHHLVQNVPIQVALEHFQKAANDPSFAAQLETRRILAERERETPKKEDDDSTKKELAALKEQLANERKASQRAQAERRMVAAANELAEKYPDAARIVKLDEADFVERVHRAADQIRAEAKEAGEQPVLDPESVVKKVQAVLQAERERAAKLYGFSSQADAEPSPSQKSSQSGQGGKPRTLSTRNSAGRSTVTEEDDFASLSLDERAARVKESARRGA